MCLRAACELGVLLPAAKCGGVRTHPRLSTRFRSSHGLRYSARGRRASCAAHVAVQSAKSFRCRRSSSISVNASSSEAPIVSIELPESQVDPAQNNFAGLLETDKSQSFTDALTSGSDLPSPGSVPCIVTVPVIFPGAEQQSVGLKHNHSGFVAAVETVPVTLPAGIHLDSSTKEGLTDIHDDRQAVSVLAVHASHARFPVDSCVDRSWNDVLPDLHDGRQLFSTVDVVPAPVTSKEEVRSANVISAPVLYVEGAQAVDVISSPGTSHEAAQAMDVISPPTACETEARAEAPSAAPPGSWRWNVGNCKRLLAFMAPAATVPMADPLMTMIDTVCIGQFAGALALASLGPANVVFGFTQYLFASMQTAALSIISIKLGQREKDVAQQVFSCALFVAMFFGVMSMTFFEYCAPALIKLTGVDALLIPSCSEYLCMRAVSQPAVLLNMVLNSCLLAQGNTFAPMTVVALTSITSLLGNLVFVGLMGWGLSGAAITTVAAQYLGCFALCMATQKSGQLRPRLKVPSLSEAELFLGTLGPLSIVYMCKNVSYMLVYTAATCMHTMALAAHQAVFALWNMCAFTTNPFESAALTFYPRSSTPQHKSSFTKLLLTMGLINGLLIGGVGAAVAFWGPKLLTSEALLWPLISSISLQLPLTLCLVGVDMAAAGLLFARGDFNYLAQSYFMTLTALAGFLYAFCYGGWGLQGIWWALVFFQAVRAVQSAGRLVWTGSLGRSVGFWRPRHAQAMAT